MTGHAATRRGTATLIAALLIAVPVLAQVTTGIVTGTVRDEQGAVVPGATVALVSATRGTRSAETVTSGIGDFVFPNVSADTYFVEVTLEVSYSRMSEITRPVCHAGRRTRGDAFRTVVCSDGFPPAACMRRGWRS